MLVWYTHIAKCLNRLKTAWWCPEWVSLCSWAGLKSDTVISEDSYTAYSVRKYTWAISPPFVGGEALPSCQHQHRKYRVLAECMTASQGVSLQGSRTRGFERGELASPARGEQSSPLIGFVIQEKNRSKPRRALKLSQKVLSAILYESLINERCNVRF